MNNSSEKLQIEIKTLYPHSKLPSRSHPNDAAWDFYAAEDVHIKPLSKGLVRLGVAVDIPKGYCLVLYDKSGRALNKGYGHLAGLIDAGYQDEIKAIIYNTNKDMDIFINNGDSVIQGKYEIVTDVNYIPVQEFSNSSDRGIKGFGSTNPLTVLTKDTPLEAFVQVYGIYGKLLSKSYVSNGVYEVIILSNDNGKHKIMVIL